MRYVLSGTIWECLILHITNNLTSGFVSSKNSNFHNPSVQLSSKLFSSPDTCDIEIRTNVCVVILTVIVYFVVLVLNWNKLKEKERVESSKKTT